MSKTAPAVRIAFILVLILALAANLPSSSVQAGGLPPSSGSTADRLWNTNFVLGANDWLEASAVAPNGDVYVAGDLSAIGLVSTGRIARYSQADASWHALGKGIPWGRIYALAISGNYLYVGGYFTSISGYDILVDNIARWNISTNTWSTVGAGSGASLGASSGDILALAVDGSGNVYAGGDFDTINGVSVMNVAKWNGSAWSAVGALGVSGDKVRALLWHNGSLIAGGMIPGKNHIASWNGSAWTTLGGGANDEVIALAADSAFLYVGGSFTNVVNPNASNVAANYIAEWVWNSSIWQPLGSGFDGPDVDALAVAPDGKLYAGGRFHQSGATTLTNLARWNGSWEPVHSKTSFQEGVDGNVYNLNFSGETLWVLGGFQSAGEISAAYVVEFGTNSTDLSWRTPGGNAPNGPVYATLVDYPYVYFGGSFSYVDTMVQSGVARYNVLTRAWTPISRLDGCAIFLCNGPVVYALTKYNGEIYAGGDFTIAGGTSVHGIARYAPASDAWSDLAGGVGCTGLFCTAVVRALRPFNSGLVVGGNFTSAGSLTPIHNLAMWNGGWNTLTDSTSFVDGPNGGVFALGVNLAQSQLYIGGSFTSPGTNILRWDGSHWNTVGTLALNGPVYAIDYFSGNLYIGGEFTDAGNIAGADYFARLNGSNWTSVVGGMDGPVRVITDDNNNDLIVGGDFLNVGGQAIKLAARWNGSTWAGIGSGLNGVSGFPRSPSVRAIQYDAGSLYFGGTFRTAGGHISDNVAIWGGSLVFLPLSRR